MWHALIHLKEQDDEEYAMLSISVFVFQKIEDGITLSSSPLGWLMHTLDFLLKIWQDKGKPALPAFVFFYLLGRKQTVFIIFLFWETVFSFCWSPALLWALYPLNSSALPIFWQLSLPYFLIIISFLENIKTYSERVRGQQLYRKSQYRMVSRM